MNREIHKTSAVMDILYIFIWIPDTKPQNYCCGTKNFIYFILVVQLLPKFHLAGPIVARTFVPWKRNLIYPCMLKSTFLKGGF